jgi:hypothetical protein
MLDLSAWRESWNKLRVEWEIHSLAHPQVSLCRWHDSEFSVRQTADRMNAILHLTEPWVRPTYRGKARKTVIPRMVAMGIGSRKTNGDGVTYWLMHERIARAAQRQPADNNLVASELDRSREVDTIFQTLGNRAGNLLRQIPDGIGFRLADGVNGIGCRLWVEALFGHTFGLWDKGVDVTHWLPSYVPANCAWDFELGQPEVIENPFAASLALIEQLQPARVPIVHNADADDGATGLNSSENSKSEPAQWPDVETVRAIGEQTRKVSEFIRDALPTTAGKRLFAANAMPSLIAELDRLTYLFYGRTLADYDSDANRSAKLGWWISLAGWIVATPGTKEHPSLAYHLRPGVQDDAIIHTRYVGWNIPVPQHCDAIWNALATLRVYFGQIVFHRDYWIRQGAWLRNEIQSHAVGLACQPGAQLSPWFDAELCRAPMFALHGPHLASPLLERPPAVPETIHQYGTFEAPKTEGVPVEWLDELDHYATKLSAAISESPNAKLIESLKPSKPIPYDPELMQAWAGAADRDWHEHIEKPRREAYRHIMPTIWLEVLEAERAGDTERMKAIQMRADRQWKEAMGVPAITSYKNLEIIMATVEAAGYPATDAGLHAWTIAKANNRNESISGVANGAGDDPSAAAHSPDFRSVRWFGTEHAFGPNQAACVKVLWEAWQNGTPDVGGKTLLETAEASTERIDVVFRGNPAWGAMIVKGNTKGSYRLAKPTDNSPKVPKRKAKKTSQRARK